MSTHEKDDEQRSESKSRRDRELIELLNELRVALPGVQVLFAFLLTVPFAQRFASVTPSQKATYFAAFLATTVASICLIAPTMIHRITFRQGNKERLLQISNVLTIVGTTFLAIAISCVVYLITDVIYEATWASIVTAVTAGAFVGIWYVVPLTGGRRND